MGETSSRLGQSKIDNNENETASCMSIFRGQRHSRDDVEQLKDAIFSIAIGMKEGMNNSINWGKRKSFFWEISRETIKKCWLGEKLISRSYLIFKKELKKILKQFIQKEMQESNKV